MLPPLTPAYHMNTALLQIQFLAHTHWKAENVTIPWALSTVWDIWMNIRDPDFGLAQPHCFHLKSELAKGIFLNFSVSLYNLTFQISKINL